MPRALSIALGLIFLLALLSVAVWFTARRVRRSDDPTKVLVKLIATLIILGLFGSAIITETGFSFGGAFAVPFVCVALGVILSVIWAPHIGSVLAKPLTSLFDGGSEELEPQPLYSVAIAKQKAGKYQEAIYHIMGQLEKFPNDATGQFLLAEIQADGLQDLQAAQLTIERFCNQPGHAPQSIALALFQLADWHLKYAQDIEAARQTLEKVLELLPDSEQALQAQQRIAHLGTTEHLVQTHDRPAIPMQAGVQNIGLLKDSSHLRPPEEDPAKKAAEYVKHLEQYPQDAEAREKLAVIYADHYQRLDLATGQLEELIQHPHQPAKQVVHWLNLLADMHIAHGSNYEAAKQALERIIELYPARSYAENARQRLDRLKLEIKGQEKPQSLQLGVYEQNIGLKKKT